MCSLVGSPEVLVEVFPSREAVTTSSIAKMQRCRVLGSCSDLLVSDSRGYKSDKLEKLQPR